MKTSQSTVTLPAFQMKAALPEMSGILRHPTKLKRPQRCPLPPPRSQGQWEQSSKHNSMRRAKLWSPPLKPDYAQRNRSKIPSRNTAKLSKASKKFLLWLTNSSRLFKLLEGAMPMKMTKARALKVSTQWSTLSSQKSSNCSIRMKAEPWSFSTRRILADWKLMKRPISSLTLRYWLRRSNGLTKRTTVWSHRYRI